MTKVGIDATNAVLFVVLQSAILQLPPFNYMALSIRSSNPVLYRVTLFIRIYKSLSRREAGYGSETLDRRQDTGDRREETIMTICIVNFDSVTTFIQ